MAKVKKSCGRTKLNVWLDVKLVGNSVLSTTFLFCLTKDYALAHKSCYHLNCCSTVHHEVQFG